VPPHKFLAHYIKLLRLAALGKRSLRRALKVVWLLYTSVLTYGLTVAPVGVVVAAEKGSAGVLPFQDPGASVRHFLMFSIEGALSAVMGWEGLAFSTILGGLTELFQYFIPWRTYDTSDLMANVIGAVFGFYAARALVKDK